MIFSSLNKFSPSLIRIYEGRFIYLAIKLKKAYSKQTDLPTEIITLVISTPSVFTVISIHLSVFRYKVFSSNYC
jgi:hypothetical protein